MPFYQVLCIAAHNPEYRQIKGLVRQAASHILNNGGVVRGIQYWGAETLPQRMRSHGISHEHGDYWTMHFDASPEKQKSLTKLLRTDPRVVRATVLKMGERIEDVAWKYPKTIIPARDVSKIP
ncbi:ribosomal protein S6 [Lactifluus subvellereus]|nr:ribosomal protein S6 [Lactifluus subvellereus]